MQLSGVWLIRPAFRTPCLGDPISVPSFCPALTCVSPQGVRRNQAAPSTLFLEISQLTSASSLLTRPTFHRFWAEFIQVPCYFLQILLFLKVSSQLFLIADLGLTRSAVMPILTPAPMIYSRQSRSIRLSVKTQPSLNISSKAGSRT